VASRPRNRWLLCCLLAAAAALPAGGRAAAQDLVRFTYHIPGDSKPVSLDADTLTTWTEGGQRIVLARGRVLLEHGVAQARSQQAVLWIDQERHRQTGVWWVDFYAEGEVTVENGPETRSGARAYVDLSTRGELKFQAHDGKVTEQPAAADPLYRRAQEVRAARARKMSSGPIQQTGFEEVVPVGPAQQPEPAMPPADAPATQSTSNAPPQAGPSPPPNLMPMPPATDAITPLPPATPPPIVGPPASGPPGTLPLGTAATLPPPRPAPANRDPLGPGSVRTFNIRPRTSASFEPQSFLLTNGEYAVVVTGGVILIVRGGDDAHMIDIEADRMVFWTKGNPAQMLSNLRSQQGQQSRELEFYLAGNVEIRERNGIEDHTLRADEVYYDVAHSIAVAMHADLEIRRPLIPDPIHLKAEELDRLSPTLYKTVKTEVFASRLPSDPGLKVFVEEATLEEKQVPKRSIFGTQYVSRTTGQPETEEQRLFNAKNVYFKLDDTPVFYLPRMQGDATDPLGPLESINIGENRMFGFQFGLVFNVYDLIGVDPIPDTRWRATVDYLSSRGPAAGTQYEYASKTFFGLPDRINTGEFRTYTIYDTGNDLLGGFRDNYPHPDWRGMVTWRENIQDLPGGFTIQGQLWYISDKNFLEEYFKNLWDTEINQSTFLYVKQQQDNWAWTFLTQQRIRNWITETDWLPRADGYLIGQSFFDRLTYNAHASVGYAHLEPTHQPPPPTEFTDMDTTTGRFDLSQELSLPFTLGPVRLVPYTVLDLTYYTEDLTGSERGRVYEGGGVRGSIPFTRIYPDIQSDLLNLNALNHKIVLSANYFYAHSDTNFFQLPQLDRLNDDATDQALRDIKPYEPLLNPGHGTFLATSPLYDPQIYAIRRLVDNRIDTLDSIDVLELDLRQRLQTHRGYPGQQHIVDWMTLDLSASYFPQPSRDNFGENWSFFEYDWVWNVGDRTALVSTGWFDPQDQGARVFTIGAFLNRPDRTSIYLGYREIDPLNSQLVSTAITYVFSPKYAMSGMVGYDYGIKSTTTALSFTRMGSDLQVSLGFTYNSLVNNFGFMFEIVPNIIPPNRRVPGMGALNTMALNH
jgi:hypothetical protein